MQHRDLPQRRCDTMIGRKIVRIRLHYWASSGFLRYVDHFVASSRPCVFAVAIFKNSFPVFGNFATDFLTQETAFLVTRIHIQMVRETMQQTILSARSLEGTNSYGGKADGLRFLSDHGFNVPRFYLLPHELLAAVADDVVLNNVLEQWKSDYAVADNSLWAVRSSAGMEDGTAKSFAGLFRTEINVPATGLRAAIRNVYDGFAKVDRHYAEQKESEFNIVLQEMLSPDYAGVAFSLHPLTGSEEVVFANLIPGLGSTLVSGDETAMTVEVKNGIGNFTEEETEFRGVTFDKVQKQIVCTAEDMRRTIQPFLPELEKGVRKLRQLKKHHVDVEFAIADGRIWWLQVRPVTAVVKKVIRTWDNSNIGENYPGLTMPLTVSLAKSAYGKSYGAMGAFLGAGKKFAERNHDLLFNMVGGIHGALYYNVTAWQQLLYQAPFGKRTSRLITRMWGADEAAFDLPQYRPSVFSYLRLLWNFCWSFLLFGYHRKKYLRVYPGIVSDYTKGQLRGKSHEELIAIYREADAKFENNWAVPMLNGFYTLIVFSALKKVVSRSRLIAKYPNFVNDVLFSSTEVISVSIVRELQSLMKEIRSDSGAYRLFASEEPANIWRSLAEISPPVYKRVVTYIENYGERCEEGELRIEAVNYKEDPLRFIEMLKSNLGVSAAASGERISFDYRKALNEIYRWRILKKLFLGILIRITVKRVRDRENFRFMRTKFFSMIRCIMREIDHVLVQAGKIAGPGDSLYLVSDEIFTPSKSGLYRELVSKRKAEYEVYARQEHHQRYAENEDGFVPVQSRSESVPGAMKGTGCCSGIVTGTVRLINAEMINDPSLEGHILVARNFEPGWISLFGKAKGLIAERGSLLSHTAILCRELGIPSVVGAAGVTKKLNDGDRIRMNGATGEIVKIENV